MKITKYIHNLKYIHLCTIAAVMIAYLFCMKGIAPFAKEGDNLFHVYLNGTPVGSVDSKQAAQDLLMEARKAIAFKSDELVFMHADLTYEGEEVLWGFVDDEEQVYQNMITVLEDSVIETMHHAYTVKVNEYLVNLPSYIAVEALLEAAIDKYDTQDVFDVKLVQDNEREFNVLGVVVENMAVLEEEKEAQEERALFPEAGVKEQMTQLYVAAAADGEKDFEDYDLGIMDIGFDKDVEIVEAYLPMGQIDELEPAIAELTVEQEQQAIYKVKSGDTLSEIAIEVNIPMDEIISMNPSLAKGNGTIQIDQELIITVPEPELSVVRHEVNYYEEIYDADVIYIDVDEWYTTQTEVLQEPSAGFRRVIAKEAYVNEKQTEREILKEEVVLEAVPKIMKRGTKIPPTYVKPISGGRVSSSFGRRSAPVKGASTYHKGIDWAVPTGTAVYASCGGTVAKAGWGSGYGYVVYINHADGRQTRYAHLSKVLVKAGESVKQNQKIALSGNTGRSSGPHLHFEILINGKQVNPVNYLN